jgi:hypothetical protein
LLSESLKEAAPNDDSRDTWILQTLSNYASNYKEIAHFKPVLVRKESRPVTNKATKRKTEEHPDVPTPKRPRKDNADDVKCRCKGSCSYDRCSCHKGIAGKGFNISL